MGQRVCVVLEVEADLPADMDTAIATVAGAAAVRLAVMRALQGGVQRVIAVMPVELAQAMMEAHDALAREIGNPSARPPADYIPPTRD